VIACNVPLGLDTEARVAMLRQPWRLPLLGWRLAAAWARLVRRRRAVGDVDVVLVGYLGHFDVVLARLLFRGTTIALDHLISASDTAADRGERGRIKGSILRAIDRLATGCADVVIVDTPEHLDLLRPEARAKGVVAPVGAPAEWFTARRDMSQSADHPLQVVFFGQFTPLQGAPVIGAALAELAPGQVDALVIGTGQDLPATQRAAGDTTVDWRSWVEPEELPELVATYDVCLGIFGTGPKALRVVPNKVFQGAAAGCAIITSDTAPQRRALGDAAVFVPAGDPDALAKALSELSADRGRVEELRQRAAARADASFTPRSVVTELRERLLA
jgi:glycosyltransferase involved in cell wall biosynthesis